MQILEFAAEHEMKQFAGLACGGRRVRHGFPFIARFGESHGSH